MPFNSMFYEFLEIFVWTCTFISVGYISRSEVAGSYGNYINCLRNYQTVFQSGRAKDF